MSDDSLEWLTELKELPFYYKRYTGGGPSKWKMHMVRSMCPPHEIREIRECRSPELVNNQKAP
jgi:hypothetical protein